MRIFVASGNEGKIKEIKGFFSNDEIIMQKQFKDFIEPEETGKTFEENALIKACSLYEFLQEKLGKNDIILGDDSGILVPDLGSDNLGVYTKRQMLAWTKQNSKSEIDFWNDIVSRVGEGAKVEFSATVAVINYLGEKFVFNNTLTGTLSFAKGSNGFGFDPIFKVNEKTFGEYTEEEKRFFNPRVKSLEQVKRDFNKFFV